MHVNLTVVSLPEEFDLFENLLNFSQNFALPPFLKIF